MWTIFKSLYWICYNNASISFLKSFWFFGCKACGILAAQPRVEPTSPAVEGEILTTGPPGKSQVKLV